MQILPVNRYSNSAPKKANLNFNGVVDKSIYKMLEADKPKIRELLLNDRMPKRTARNMAVVYQKTIESFEKLANNLHPETRVSSKKYNFEGQNITTQKGITLYATNKLLKHPLDIASADYLYMYTDTTEGNAVLRISATIENDRPAHVIDRDLFNENTDIFLNDVKEKLAKGLIIMDDADQEETKMVKAWSGFKNFVANKATGSVTKSELIKQAQEFDTLAPEFHSRPVILDRLYKVLNSVDDEFALPEDLTKLDVLFDNIYYKLKERPDEQSLKIILENNEININHVDSFGDNLLMNVLKQKTEWGINYPDKETAKQRKVINSILNHPKLDIEYVNRKGENALTTFMDNRKDLGDYTPIQREIIKKMGINYFNPVTEETLFDTVMKYTDNYWLGHDIVKEDSFDFNKNKPIFKVLELGYSDIVFKWMQNPKFNRNVKNDIDLSLEEVIAKKKPHQKEALAYNLVLLKEKYNADTVFTTLDNKEQLIDFFTKLEGVNNNKDLEFIRICFEKLFNSDQLEKFMPKIENAKSDSIKTIAKNVFEIKYQKAHYVSPFYVE